MPNRSLGILGCLVVILNTPAFALAQYDRRTAIVEAVAKTRDAIVNLRTIRNVPAKFEDADETGRVRGLGTGVIIDPRGYIVTNFHVIEDVDKIEVMTSSEQKFDADVMRQDRLADLAILKIRSNRQFAYLPLVDTIEPLLGETVIAIGNPYGLDNSVTTGIVSHIHRELRLPNGEVFRDLIQNDASINPGNSGGPLLNINGDLLGINVAIRSNAQGIGFAIPTRTVRTMVSQLMDDRSTAMRSLTRAGLKFGEVAPSRYLDPNAQNVTSVSAETNTLVTVKAVDGAAERLGLRSGDELLSVNKEKICCLFDLERVLWDRAPGDSLYFQIRRAERELAVQIAIPPAADADVIWERFGIKVAPISASEVQSVIDDLKGGLKLLAVAPGSVADRAGFRVDDILIGLHDFQTIEPSNVRYIMQWDQLGKNQPIDFHIIRNGRHQRGKLTMPAE